MSSTACVEADFLSPSGGSACFNSLKSRARKQVRQGVSSYDFALSKPSRHRPRNHEVGPCFSRPDFRASRWPTYSSLTRASSTCWTLTTRRDRQFRPWPTTVWTIILPRDSATFDRNETSTSSIWLHPSKRLKGASSQTVNLLSSLRSSPRWRVVRLMLALQACASLRPEGGRSRWLHRSQARSICCD